MSVGLQAASRLRRTFSRALRRSNESALLETRAACSCPPYRPRRARRSGTIRRLSETRRSISRRRCSGAKRPRDAPTTRRCARIATPPRSAPGSVCLLGVDGPDLIARRGSASTAESAAPEIDKKWSVRPGLAGPVRHGGDDRLGELVVATVCARPWADGRLLVLGLRRAASLGVAPLSAAKGPGSWRSCGRCSLSDSPCGRVRTGSGDGKAGPSTGSWTVTRARANSRSFERHGRRSHFP
jgi:hypothetical protein